jgi:hypothetical protein
MSYEIAAVVGDVNPIQYGGWLVGRGAHQVDAIVLEPIDWEEKETTDVLVYLVALDRFKLVWSSATKAARLLPCEWDNTWHWGPDGHDEWFDTESFREHVAGFVTWDEFTLLLCSEDPVQRAVAWKEIASYHGIENLDSQPSREKCSELVRRFALPFYRARKRGVTVYA